MISAVQTADSGSFTAAARVLGLTPAAVSKNVASLEALLQVRLFNRTTRQLSLTEEGKVFIHQTRQGLGSLEAAATAATQGLRPQGWVRVNCPIGFGRRFVLPLLPAFYAAYPSVKVELNLNDQKVDLVQDGFDVGIRGGSEPPEGMVARTICKLEAVLVATPHYLKAHGTPQHFSELAGHRLLRVKFLNGSVTPWLFKDKGKLVAIEGQASLLISDPELILDAALLDMGIARMGRHHAFAALQCGELLEVLPRQHHGGSARMTMFYPHRAGLAPRVRVLVDFILMRLLKDPVLQG